MKKINCDAAKQMLVYYYSSSTSDHASQHIDRYNFINDPYNKMPTKCKSIAISCGSGNGQNQGYNAGTIQYYVSDSIDLKAKWQIGTIGDDPPEPIYLEAEYENGAYFSLKIKSLPNNQSIWFLESHLLVLAGSIGNYPLGSLIFPSLRSVNEHLSSPIKPYDNCPGGYQQLIKGLVYALADLGIPHNNYESKECFVPSISALDLNTEDLFFNIYGSLTDGNNYFINNGNPITPFSEFFVDSINQPHIVNGISLGMVRWILNQTVKDTMYIQDTTFTSVEKQLEAKKVIFSGSGLLGNNFKIINNSKITFVAGESIILSPGFSVESGSEFHAYIYNHDCIFTDQTYTTNINEIQNAPLFSTQKQNIATKTKSLKKDVDIDISPNPTDGFFKFRFKNKEDEKWNFMIFDMMGKLVKTTTPLNASNEYCLRKPGIYIVKILDKNKLVKIKKLIVK